MSGECFLPKQTFKKWHVELLVFHWFLRSLFKVFHAWIFIKIAEITHAQFQKKL